MSLIRARYRAVNTIMNLPSGGGFVGLLDLFPNAAAAYSLRKLRAAYSGAAVRVRESGGNTEADIGFDANGDLDTTSLLAHCGANDGFVTVWYDQSLSNDATQTTANKQPKIVSGGSVVIQGGKTSIDFGTISENKCLSLNTSSTSNFITIVHNVTYKGTKNQVLLALSNSNYIIITSTDMGKLRYVNSDDDMISTTNVGTFQLSTIDINDGKLYTNSLEEDSVTTASGATTRYVIGNYTTTSGNELEGYVSELIIFDSDQSANRTGIEGSINEYYNIY